jgi:hypothetical protein
LPCTPRRIGHWRDAEDNFDVVVIDLDSAYDGMDDLTHSLPVEPIKTLTNLGGKVLQPADHQ